MEPKRRTRELWRLGVHSGGQAGDQSGDAQRQQAESPHPSASLAEIVRIYGIRHWIV